MNLNLARGNGPDTYTVSQNSPLFDILDHVRESQGFGSALNTLNAYATHIEHEIRDQVARCRMVGMSWQEIADELEITKQGAQQRYGD